MAGEVVGTRGRIKYAEHRRGSLQLAAPLPLPLQQLAALMARLEAAGAVPVLDDGLVGGNCAIAAAAVGGAEGLSESNSSGGGGGGSSSSDGGGASTGEAGIGILISRSGKQPGAALQALDWVLLTRFDATRWEAEFMSAGSSIRPSSDAPLHAAALSAGAAERYSWAVQPLVAVHGHALAEGPGLERARQQGLPISEQETLFSTPEDLHEIEVLFRSFPYPAHRCYIRRGHGFLLLSQNVAEAEEYIEQHLLQLSGPLG